LAFLGFQTLQQGVGVIFIEGIQGFWCKISKVSKLGSLNYGGNPLFSLSTFLAGFGEGDGCWIFDEFSLQFVSLLVSQIRA